MSLTMEAFRKLDADLAKIADRDLGQWDQDFVDDMGRRLARWGVDTHISGAQWAQIERLRDQHL